MNMCNRQRKQPLQPHDIPSQPWVNVGSDLFDLKGDQFCLVVYYFSQFPEIVHLGSRSVTKALTSVISRHGIPQILMTDYASAEFKDFTRKWEFSHITSLPTQCSEQWVCRKKCWYHEVLVEESWRSILSPVRIQNHANWIHWHITSPDADGLPSQL